MYALLITEYQLTQLWLNANTAFSGGLQSGEIEKYLETSYLFNLSNVTDVFAEVVRTIKRDNYSYQVVYLKEKPDNFLHLSPPIV